MNEMRGDGSSSHATAKSGAMQLSPPVKLKSESRSNVMEDSTFRTNTGSCVDFSPPKNLSNRSSTNKNVVLTANVVTVAKDKALNFREGNTRKMVRVNSEFAFWYLLNATCHSLSFSPSPHQSSTQPTLAMCFCTRLPWYKVCTLHHSLCLNSLLIHLRIHLSVHLNQ